jgi:hypothetical protein
MSPAKKPEIRVDEFNELKTEVAEIKESVTQIQLEFMKNLTALSASVKSIEAMMKDGFAVGKETCYNHRQNIEREIERIAETQEKHADRIGEIEKRSAAAQVIIGIVSALLTALITTAAIKLIH